MKLMNNKDEILFVIPKSNGFAKIFSGNKNKLLSKKFTKEDVSFVDVVFGDYELMMMEHGVTEYLLWNNNELLHLGIK